MSAPDTNVEKLEKRHRPSLAGMAVAVTFAVILFVAFVAYLAEMGKTPGDEQVEVNIIERSVAEN